MWSSPFPSLSWSLHTQKYERVFVHLTFFLLHPRGSIPLFFFFHSRLTLFGDVTWFPLLLLPFPPKATTPSLNDINLQWADASSRPWWAFWWLCLSEALDYTNHQPVSVFQKRDAIPGNNGLGLRRRLVSLPNVYDDEDSSYSGKPAEGGYYIKLEEIATFPNSTRHSAGLPSFCRT